nr:hypothetical protein [Cupriavidus taiwanensis]
MSGSASFRPDTAFDDGKAIWLRIPKGPTGPLPWSRMAAISWW